MNDPEEKTPTDPAPPLPSESQSMPAVTPGTPDDAGVARVLAAVDRLHKVSREYSDTISAAIQELRDDVESQYERLARSSDRSSKRLDRIEKHLGLPPLDGNG
jgi:hypothetical protein